MPLIKSGSKAAISSKKWISKTCAHCTARFKVPAYRDRTARYCSKICHGNAMRGGPPLVAVCAICGKAHQRPPSHMNVPRPTCSMKCRGIASRTDRPPTRDIPAVKKWLQRRGLIKACSKCRYEDHPEILVLHHKDRDRSNNMLDNLEVLCPNCHALEHVTENRHALFDRTTRRRPHSALSRKVNSHAAH